MPIGDGIRRNILTVSAVERQRLRNAILALQQKKYPGNRTDSPPGGVSYWFKQDEIHQATHVHGGPEFLPWHRELVNRFEQSIREIDPELSLHYWDWNTDPHPLFTSDFMGNTNGDAGAPWLGKIYDPGADPAREDTGNPADLHRTLTRDLQAGAPTIDPPGSPSDWPNDVDILAAPTYQQMRDLLESAHNSAHSTYIGGTIGNPHISFRDPFVFLLHSNVDRLFAMWQTQMGQTWRLDPNQVYGTESPALNVNLEPWSGGGLTTRPWAPPENLQSPKTYKHPSVVRPPCYDTLSTYPATVTLETPSINFNDVPEGETTVRAAVFSTVSCGDVHFQITSGPSVVMGPPGTNFGILPLTGSSDTVPPTSDFTLAKAHIWISYQGTSAGDNATGTVTIHCAETNEDFVIPITANTIARPTVAVVLALDKSNSMNFDSGIDALPKRIDVLKYSAPPFVDVIQEGNAMGIASFDHDAYDVIGITGPLGPPPQNPFDDPTRANLKNLILSHTPNPMGNTAIGDAVEKAHNILQTPAATSYDKKATIIFTDGYETAAKYISDVTDLVDEKVFAVALGTAQQIQPNALNQLCNDNEGFLLLTGALGNDDFFRLNKYFLQVLAGVTNNEIVVDPEGWIKPGEKHRIPFRLSEADIGSDVILLTPAPPAVAFMLETPDGSIIDPALANVTPGMSHSYGTRVSFYRMTLPAVINGTGFKEGVWHAILTTRDRVPRASVHLEASTVAKTNVHGIHYSLNVHCYSNLRMRARLSQTSNEPGAQLTTRVVLTEYGLPVHRRATVRLELLRPDNTTVMLIPEEVEPGIFETNVEAKLTGIYRFHVRAAGATMHGKPFNREQTLTGAIWKGGDQPPPTSKDDPSERADQLCHLLQCLLSDPKLAKFLEKYGIDTEMLRRCLGRFCKEQSPTMPSVSGVLDEVSRSIEDPEMRQLLSRVVELAGRKKQ
ncbi:MAG: tyrosinase family protein [Thermoproteota archaeon]|nr:tyrosinase family protein [Thermoproteota archaeon]